MKSVIILLLVLVYLQVRAAPPEKNPPAVLEYHLNWDGASSIMKISLLYTPAGKDSTVFDLSNKGFGGQQDLFKIFGHFTSGDEDKIRVLPEKGKVIVFHQRQGLHRLEYDINGKIDTSIPGRAIIRELFRPVIRSGSLYLISGFFLLNPEKHDAPAISLQFDHVPSGMVSFLSWAPGADPTKKQIIDTVSRNDLLIVMDSELDIQKYDVHGIPYYSVTSRRDTINNMKKELAPYFTAYFPGLRDFWKDNRAGYYYTGLFPLQSSADPAGGGFGWGPGFIMKYQGPFDDHKKEVIAHETSHTWIGQRLRIGQGSFSNQWFGEGFNDYVCLINIFRCGIFTKDMFLRYLNEENFRKHYISPVKNAPNDSIAAHYWTNREYEKLPYRRGLIYAFYLDNQIRLATGGKQTLRNMLLNLQNRDLALRKINGDSSLTINDFVNACAPYLPESQIRQELSKYMFDGVPLNFKKIRLIPEFSITFSGQVPVLALSENANAKKIFDW